MDHDFPANSFQNDGVELFFNPDLDGDDGWGPGKFQLYVDAAGDGEILDNNRGHTQGILGYQEEPQEGEVWTAGLVNDDESGYVVEFQIPLGTLDTAGGDEGDPVPLKTGEFVLINAAIDDNDEGDNLGGQTGHHVLWHAEGAGSPFGGGEAIWNVPLVLTEGGPDGPAGDLTGDGSVNGDDIDAIAKAIRDGDSAAKFDLDGSGAVDPSDRNFIVNDILNTFFGDADLNGEFNSGDFVTVFTAGLYETGNAAGWATGDWNGDGFFDSGDFVVAFQDGGYETGPKAATAAVPEPANSVLVILAIAGLACLRRRA